MAKMHETLSNIIADAMQGEDSRKYRRIALPAKARFLLPDGTEQPGRIINISAGGAFVRARPGTTKGDRILLYIHKLGRFEANAVRIERGGFAVSFIGKKRRFKRTADTLIWLLNDGERALNRRGAERVHQDKPATAILAGGERKPCRILDISVTGASVSLEPKPSVGEPITIGRMKGFVVRHHETGFGVEFAQRKLA